MNGSDFVLELNNVSKTYKNSNKKAIDNINLSVEPGDIYGFIGPNGAGKSTTIKCIVGIHSYDEGEILFNGISVKENALAVKEQIAYVPDNPDLYEYLSGIKYLNFIANIYGVDADTKNSLIDKYAKLFAIEKDLANPIKTYSHGMKQKIALISALIHKPKLIILDEPFVGLDPKASFDLKNILTEICQEGGIVFFSSHVLEVVERFCNKIAIIKDGKIIASGRTDEVKGEGTLEERFLGLFNE